MFRERIFSNQAGLAKLIVSGGRNEKDLFSYTRMESPRKQIQGIAIHPLSQRIANRRQGSALSGFFLSVDETFFRTRGLSYRIYSEKTALALATLVSEKKAYQDYL